MTHRSYQTSLRAKPSLTADLCVDLSGIEYQSLTFDRLNVPSSKEETLLNMLGLRLEQIAGHQLAACIAFELAMKPPPASAQELQAKALGNANKLKQNNGIFDAQRLGSFSRQGSPFIYVTAKPLKSMPSVSKFAPGSAQHTPNPKLAILKAQEKGATPYT